MGSTRRKFTPEFKAEAVELLINSGKPVAKLLGTSESATGH
jgi:transposase-like protein